MAKKSPLNKWLRKDGSLAVGLVTLVDSVKGTGIDSEGFPVQWHGDALPTNQGGGSIFPGVTQQATGPSQLDRIEAHLVWLRENVSRRRKRG